MNRSYKQVMQQRVGIIVGTAVLALVAVAVAFLVKRFGFGEMQTSEQQIIEVLTFLIPFEVVLIFRAVRYSLIIKDEEKLEAMEISEFDERGKFLRHAASRMSVWLMIILLGLSSLIAYFFNQTVYLTLGITLVVLLIVYGISWMVYAKRN